METLLNIADEAAFFAGDPLMERWEPDHIFETVNDIILDFCMYNLFLKKYVDIYFSENSYIYKITDFAPDYISMLRMFLNASNQKHKNVDFMVVGEGIIRGIQSLSLDSDSGDALKGFFPDDVNIEGTDSGVIRDIINPFPLSKESFSSQPVKSKDILTFDVLKEDGFCLDAVSAEHIFIRPGSKLKTGDFFRIHYIASPPYLENETSVVDFLPETFYRTISHGTAAMLLEESDRPKDLERSFKLEAEYLKKRSLARVYMNRQKGIYKNNDMVPV